MQAQEQIALITDKYSARDSLDPRTENGGLLAFLRNKGLKITSEIWDDDKVDWSQYKIVIIKTPWDYVDKIEAFIAWLNKLQQSGVRALNPIEVLKWNSDKIYLKDIQEKGIEIIPTIWLDKNTKLNISELFEQLGVDKIIIKPRVSGTARDTYALTKEQALKNVDYLQKLLNKKDLMAQPFMKEIVTKGEFSLVFFNGEYSHTILKTVKRGDFRVQGSFGGKSQAHETPSHLLDSVQKIVDKFGKGCLYARVDGLEVNGRFVVMELELIEPYLFLNYDKGALEKYYKALSSLLEQSS